MPKRIATQAFTSLFLSLTFSFSWACEDSPGIHHSPFAKELAEQGKMKVFEIFTPKKHGEFFLTSIDLHRKNILHVSLEHQSSFTYPNHQQSSLMLNTDDTDKYEIHLNYSTTQDGGLVMCGGNLIKTSITSLLEAKQPKEMIPPPPKVTQRNH